jgi:predicted nucleic acid-binding protein
VRFFDASALVKRYVREPETARVRKLIRAGDVAVSRLSEVEVVSAFARLGRDDAVTTQQRGRIARAFVRDLAVWTVVEVTPKVARRTRELLLRHPLRVGDAIQLASALVLQDELDVVLDAFVEYDARLRDAARAEGFAVEP